MGKWLRRLLFLICLLIFLVSAGKVGTTLYGYHLSDALYAETADAYVAPAPDKKAEYAPITVDFDALHAVNEDIIGWIYCEDSVINYPVLQGENNDQYLHTTYEGEHITAGSIFVDSLNSGDFSDPNTIVYGHHMRNKSMFASLEYWAEQDYYESHPVMWLLTPEQDYRIDLFSGYNTPAGSDTYLLFSGFGEEFNQYVADCKAKSDFVPHEDVTVQENSHVVTLSTCAYIFRNARYVLQGALVPLDSAAGVPIA